MNETQNNTGKINAKNLWLTFGFGVAVALIWMVTRSDSRASDVEQLLAITSRQVNLSCPKLEDPTTRLDSTQALPNKTFQYNYTLTDLLRDSTDIELLYAGFETAMIKNAKSNPDLQLFRNHNVTFVYRFFDRAGSMLTRIVINPEKYR
jgi:hypothetical protein